MAEAMKYFSTKFTIIMLGARYIPSVCYKLDEIIAPTVTKLAEAGEAHLYTEKVRFVNGIALPVKKPEVRAEVKAQENSAVSGIGKKGSLPNKKGGKKDFE